MSGSQTTNSTNYSTTMLPQWVQSAGQQNYGLAQNLAAQPYNPAMNQNVAALSPQQQLATALSQGNVGQAQALTGQGTGTLSGLLGFTPQQVQGSTVNAGSLAGTDLSPYLNPYTNNVINSTVGLMNQQNLQDINANNANAVKAGAFGGSRQGVQNAVLQAQNTQNIGNLAANLNSQNFSQAQAAATNDINRNLQAGTTNAQLAQQAALANQSAGLQGAGLNQTAANSLINAGSTLQGQNAADVAGLLQTGALQQGQQQNVLNAATQNAQAQRGYDVGNLQMLLTTLGATPYNVAQYGQGSQQSTQSNPLGAVMGGAQLLGGLLKLSEDDMKTDVQKVGKAPHSDVNVYAFRYKNDPKSYPKTVGLMASDVEKKHPSAVRRIGGKRVINMSRLQGA